MLIIIIQWKNTSGKQSKLSLYSLDSTLDSCLESTTSYLIHVLEFFHYYDSFFSCRDRILLCGLVLPLQFPLLQFPPKSTFSGKLELPSSSDTPTSASQSSGIMGVSHYSQPIMILYLFIFLFWDGVLLCHPGRSAVAQSWLTTTSASWVQAILPPQPPE